MYYIGSLVVHMEKCIICKSEVRVGVWGSGDGKRLYVRNSSGYKPVAVICYPCLRQMKPTKKEKESHD